MASKSLDLHLAQEPDADKLLSESPFALLVGMLLDQQFPVEHAFRGPKKIADRMGGLDVHKIAGMDTEAFEDLCATPPAVHRYGRSMARRIQELSRYLIAEYDGVATAVWSEGDPDGKEVLRRLKALPGYGDQKARIFLALLAKQLGVAPAGWEQAAGAYAEPGSRRSAADIVDEKSLLEVRAFKKDMKAKAAAAKQG